MSQLKVLQNQGFNIPTPDFDRLNKLDDILEKHDIYMKNQLVQQTNKVLVETINHTYTVYDLIIEELIKQFGELQIEAYGSIINKIFIGHKTIFSVLLQLLKDNNHDKDQLLNELQLFKNQKLDFQQNSSNDSIQNKLNKTPINQSYGSFSNKSHRIYKKSQQFNKSNDIHENLSHCNKIVEELNNIEQQNQQNNEKNIQLEQALKNNMNFNFEDGQEVQKQLNQVMKDMNIITKKINSCSSFDMDLSNIQETLADINQSNSTDDSEYELKNKQQNSTKRTNIIMDKLMKNDQLETEYIEEKQSNSDESEIDQVQATNISHEEEISTIQDFISVNEERKLVQKQNNLNQEQNLITETIDENGNKIIIEKVFFADGWIQFTTKDENGNILKQIQEKVDKNGNIIENINEEIISQQIISLLIKLGFSSKKAELIVNALLTHLHKGGKLIIDGDELATAGNKIEERERRRREAEERKQRLENERREKMELINLRKQKKQENHEQEEELDVIDDGNRTEEEQIETLYQRLKKYGDQQGELLRQIRNQTGLQGDENISYDHFKEYFQKYKQIHFKCGDNCIHLNRFYEKLGFIQNKYKRKFFKMNEPKVTLFKQNNKILQMNNNLPTFPKIKNADVINKNF